MAFASVGSIGTANEKVADTSISLTVGSAIPVGAIVAVWSAWQAAGPAGGCGTGARGVCQRAGCTDSKGNFYTTVMSREDSTTTSPSPSMFVTQLRTALANGDTITVASISNVAAKAISAWQFSVAAGNTWAISDECPQNRVDNGVDPGSISIASLDSREWLFLHVLGSRGPSTDTYTWDADYTTITFDGTTGGLDNSNIQVCGGFRIATLTSDTVDVTSDTADRNYVQGYVALTEVAVPTFPTTPILDTFTRADENPLDNGTWDASACTAGSATKDQLISNRAAPAGGGGQWWLTQNTVRNAEVYVTQPVKPGVGGEALATSLVLHGTNCGNNSTRTGDAVAWVRSSTGGGGAVTDGIRWGDAGNDSGIQGGLIQRTAVPQADGVKLGLSRRDAGMFIWVDVGSGWELVAAAWRTHINRSSGKMGLVLAESAIRCDDFGGGESILTTPHLLPILHVGA